MIKLGEIILIREAFRWIIGDILLHGAHPAMEQEYCNVFFELMQEEMCHFLWCITELTATF